MMVGGEWVMVGGAWAMVGGAWMMVGELASALFQRLPLSCFNGRQYLEWELKTEDVVEVWEGGEGLKWSSRNEWAVNRIRVV